MTETSRKTLGLNGVNSRDVVLVDRRGATRWMSKLSEKITNPKDLLDGVGEGRNLSRSGVKSKRLLQSRPPEDRCARHVDDRARPGTTSCIAGVVGICKSA